MSGGWIFFCIVFMVAGWWTFAYIRTPKAPPPKPVINVLEMTSYDYGGGAKSLSETAMLLWRLYPDQIARGVSVMHPNFIHAQRFGKADERVAVFLIINGEPVVIEEEDGTLFPSDALVTKIRLMHPK